MLHVQRTPLPWLRRPHRQPGGDAGGRRHPDVAHSPGAVHRHPERAPSAASGRGLRHGGRRLRRPSGVRHRARQHGPGLPCLRDPAGRGAGALPGSPRRHRQGVDPGALQPRRPVLEFRGDHAVPAAGAAAAPAHLGGRHLARGTRLGRAPRLPHHDRGPSPSARQGARRRGGVARVSRQRDGIPRTTIASTTCAPTSTRTPRWPGRPASRR